MRMMKATTSSLFSNYLDFACLSVKDSILPKRGHQHDLKEISSMILHCLQDNSFSRVLRPMECFYETKFISLENNSAWMISFFLWII